MLRNAVCQTHCILRRRNLRQLLRGYRGNLNSRKGRALPHIESFMPMMSRDKSGRPS